MNRRRFTKFLFLTMMAGAQITAVSGIVLADDDHDEGSREGGHGGEHDGESHDDGRGPGPSYGGGAEPGSRSEHGRGEARGDRRGSRRSEGPSARARRTREGPRSANSKDAFSARNRGEIVSLKDVLSSAKSAKPGDVIEVKLFQKPEGSIYRVKTIDDDGVVHTVHLDAHTGKVMGLLGIVKRSLGLNEDTDRGR